MAIYSEVIGACASALCPRPATHRLMRSGTDSRGLACSRHVHKLGRELAARLGEEYVSDG